MAARKALSGDPEFAAMRSVYEALEPLNEQARERVWRYVSQRLGIQRPSELEAAAPAPAADQQPVKARDASRGAPADPPPAPDGVSPVAVKWMTRSGISSEGLSKIFSIDLDEIDLVASSVPGDSKRARLHNVFRLTAMAEYLASGAPRVTHEELKEACQHYDAYDVDNHAASLKALGREVSGTRESGYTLTATGITSATKLIKDMISSPANKA